ncbi:MAG: DUF1826 domain-containing protein [Pseudomonadota bacterium]
MNVARPIAAAAAVAITKTPDALSAFREPGCAAMVWSRSLRAGLQEWLEQLAPEQLPTARVIVRPDQIRQAAAEVCDASGTPDSEERAMLIDDIDQLAQHFASVMQTPYLQLRLDVITNNACRKFHVDAVTARLVCTYRGTGTQYGIATADGQPTDIATITTGSPILLRGTLWPEHPRSGLLHRSPPIEGTGETRLLLVLDPVTDPSEHPSRWHTN